RHVVESKFWLRSDVDAAFGDEHVAPEITVSARAPHRLLERLELRALALSVPFARFRVGERGIGQSGDGRHVNGARLRREAVDAGGSPGAFAGGRVPASAQRRS